MSDRVAIVCANTRFSTKVSVQYQCVSGLSSWGVQCLVLSSGQDGPGLTAGQQPRWNWWHGLGSSSRDTGTLLNVRQYRQREHTHWERQITADITETEYFESPYNAVNRYIIILSTCNDIPLPCTVYTYSKTRRFTPHTQWDGGGGACDTRVYMLHSKLCRQNRLWNTRTPTHSDQNNHQNDCLIIGSTALHNTTKWS